MSDILDVFDANFNFVRIIFAIIIQYYFTQNIISIYTLIAAFVILSSILMLNFNKCFNKR